MEPTVNPLGVAGRASPLPVSPEQATSARLEGIEDALKRLAGGRPPGLLRDFARAFHFGTPFTYFSGRSDEELAGEIISAFDFVDDRKSGEVRVRVVALPDRTVAQVTMRDQPFLLDSARETIRGEGVAIHRYLHPILRTERDAAGRLAKVRPRPEPGFAESFLHFEAEPLPPDEHRAHDENRADDDHRARLEKELRATMHEAAVAAEDYPQMRAAVEMSARAVRAEQPTDPAFRQELEEAAAFLDWLLKGNFIFLGYRAYNIEPRPGGTVVTVAPRSGLGILRDPSASTYAEPVPLDSLDPALRSRIVQRIFPLVSKTNRLSRVHRRAQMDYVGIKKLSPSGEVAGEHRILGFFTTQALNQIGSEIPVLRLKLSRILARAQVLEGSHDYKEIVSIFNGLPKAELFATADEEIARTIETVLEMQTREGIRVDCRPDNLGRGLSVMVLMPRDRFNSDVRQRIQASFATRFGSPPADYRLALGEEPHARMHFYFPISPGQQCPPAEVLEQDVHRAVRTWDDALREELEARFGAERAAQIAARYAPDIPSTYRATFEPGLAVDDLPFLEELRAQDGVRVRITGGPRRGGEGTALLRLYRSRSKFYLSEVMPILTNLGLKVIDELTFRFGRPPDPVAYLHTIRVQRGLKPSGATGGLPAERWAALVEAIQALLSERYENDGLGALVVAGLSVRQVELLRAYLHFYRQLRVPFTMGSMIGALVEHEEIARRLVEHFEAKFRPVEGEPEARAERLNRVREKIHALLERVEDLNQDRILRGLLELIEATIRTNYFQKGGTLPRLALKLESRRISAMPRPVPLFEIFVHNAEMEGVHLRAGKVARGGIRWSDRRDDFRTEILGLMRTQHVKNAVIVPMGSKGGFVLKRAGESREALPGLVARQYRTLISGMLDLTDNLVKGKVVHPPECVIYDGPDPYLVVAADKGTATFSDLANQIAAEYGFWLEDAFASGGSHGYDHKKEAITARGAWECARHHLLELGIDPEGEITVAGIGDMSGDVFGNGLLLSSKFKLLAAFDHRHVFLDPSPDPKTSYEERKRLFELPSSSWADYDTAKISKGGGAFRRDQKRIALSPEVQKLIGTTAEALTGEELVREVLKLPVHMLWNGGIGTYVKSSQETHADVGDAKNDPYRVDAPDLRARVFAEGGNLGFTQAARVEYALRGGKINTDSIDNSAGVDLSDHEVNIKIALAGGIAAGKLDLLGRDRLLEEMKEEVCTHVLLHNRQHAQILSVEEAISREDLYPHLVLEQNLTEAGLFEAKFEKFPDAAELKRRAERRIGLMRPELALLLAFAKIDVCRDLHESPVLESPDFEEYLTGYFPLPLRERHGDLLSAHPLKREIAASNLVNEMTHRVGITFAARFKRELGATTDAIVRAYRVADLLLQGAAFIDPIRDQLADGSLPPAAARELFMIYRGVCEDLVHWLLRNWPAAKGGEAKGAAALLKKLKPPFEKAKTWLEEAAPARLRERLSGRSGELANRGVPKALAARAAALEMERYLLPTAAVAQQTKVEADRVAAGLFAIREVLHLAEVERVAAQLPVADPDDRSAARSLLEELRALGVRLAAQLLAAAPEEADLERAAEDLLAGRDALAAYRQALPAAGRPFTLGSLMVLVERLRRVAGD